MKEQPQKTLKVDRKSTGANHRMILTLKLFMCDIPYLMRNMLLNENSQLRTIQAKPVVKMPMKSK